MGREDEMGKDNDSLREMIMGVSDKWNALTPLMIQMGIIEELLHRKLVLSEREGPSYTVSITPEGFTVEEGSDPFAHARMCTTRQQWEDIFGGARTYATIFRFDLAPERDVVPLQEMALVERFSTIIHALVNLPRG
jgi:hypothetical protein